MIAMDNSLTYLLQCQLRVKQGTTHALQCTYQPQQKLVNDSLIDDIPTFDRKPEQYFDWILKLENIVVVTK